MDFVQTSSAAPVPDPTWRANFDVDAAVYNSVTLPSGSTVALIVDDDEAYLSRYFTSKAEMDTAFPNGAYRLSGPGAPARTLALGPDIYPVDTPQLVSATNGAWGAGGAFIINPTQACTLTFNTFTGYTNPGAAGFMSFDLESSIGGSTKLERDVVSKAFGDDITVEATPFTTYTIPANTLTTGQIYEVDLAFGTFPVLDAASLTHSGFVKKTRFFLTALTSGTPPAPLAVTTQPASQVALAGGRVTLTAAFANNNGGVQWLHDGEHIDEAVAGKYTLSQNRLSLTVNNLTAADSGGYSVRMLNVGGTLYSAVAQITVPTIPVISKAPVAQNAVAGGRATFTVAASGAPNTYQWRKDNVALPGATAQAATLALSNVSAANAGNYSVVITNPAGAVTSAAVPLALVSANQSCRLINLSILTAIGAGGDNFTMGYVVGGAGTSGVKPLVVRAAGPSLSRFNVSGALDDPKLELFAGSVRTGDNDNWGGGAELTTAMAAVGAFGFTGPTSRDAAALVSTSSRDNSVRVFAAGAGSGAVIAELYDATPSASFGAATPRLVNVSVLKNLGAGFTAGFVVGGTTSQTVLIRAIGPTLAAAPFSVPGVVADPQVALFSDTNQIAENGDWGGTAALTAAFAQVGAFTLPAGSQDAALLTTLAPGDYTVQVASPIGTSGTVLVEVYEVP